MVCSSKHHNEPSGSVKQEIYLSAELVPTFQAASHWKRKEDQ
jgi:hypothetical protein